MELRCPDASPETPSSPCTAGLLARGTGGESGTGRGRARMWCCGCPGAQRVGRGRDFHRHPPRQNLVNVKPHPVVSPRDGTRGRWVAVIPWADVAQR